MLLTYLCRNYSRPNRPGLYVENAVLCGHSSEVYLSISCFVHTVGNFQGKSSYRLFRMLNIELLHFKRAGNTKYQQEPKKQRGEFGSHTRTEFIETHLNIMTALAVSEHGTHD